VNSLYLLEIEREKTHELPSVELERRQAMQNGWNQIAPEMYHGVACDEQMTDPDWARGRQILVHGLLHNLPAMTFGFVWLE